MNKLCYWPGLLVDKLSFLKVVYKLEQKTDVEWNLNCAEDIVLLDIELTWPGICEHSLRKWHLNWDLVNGQELIRKGERGEKTGVQVEGKAGKNLEAKKNMACPRNWGKSARLPHEQQVGRGKKWSKQGKGHYLLWQYIKWKWQSSKHCTIPSKWSQSGLRR